MHTLPLVFKNNHLFVELTGSLWLFDTGAMTSFGDISTLNIAEEQFKIRNSYMGFSAAALSQFFDVPCSGVLGSDILGEFDHLLDCMTGTISCSKAELPHNGHQIRLTEFMGVPILSARIADKNYPMFFDSGAQISFFQDEKLTTFPSAGCFTDFFPSFGQFQTETHHVDVSLDGIAFTLRCGTLPGLLGTTLVMADTQGIIGNEILLNRVTGYFPRRNVLCL